MIYVLYKKEVDGTFILGAYESFDLAKCVKDHYIELELELGSFDDVTRYQIQAVNFVKGE